METSEKIGELITALAAAQGEFKAVPKSARNPHLGNMYATLDGVIDAIRGPLSKNGLAIVQPLTDVDGTFWLETRLMHSSGEWIASAAPITSFSQKGINPLQEFGGALTYMRRYMITSLLGINTEEDADGNGSKPKREAKRKPAQPPSPKAEPEPVQHWIDKETQNGKKVSAMFWAWAKSEMSLTEAQVYAALEVEHIHDYTGSMGDAKTKINEWITKQADAEPVAEGAA